MAKKYIDGADKVRRALRGISQESAEGIAHALNLGAREIAKRAEILVPHDTHELSKDIHVEKGRILERADGKAVAAGVTAGTTKANAHAAFRSEFGRAPGPGKHPGHPGQSWFFDAYHSVRKRVRGRVKRAIKKAAKEVAARGR